MHSPGINVEKTPDKKSIPITMHIANAIVSSKYLLNTIQIAAANGITTKNPI